MEDNALVHKAKKTVRYWADHEVTLIVWPLCSPDLNSIENIWQKIKQMIRKMEKLFRTVSEMQKVFQWA